MLEGVEYLMTFISCAYTPTISLLGVDLAVWVIGDYSSFGMEQNQILEISAIRNGTYVICRVASASNYTEAPDSGSDGTFG